MKSSGRSNRGFAVRNCEIVFTSKVWARRTFGSGSKAAPRPVILVPHLEKASSWLTPVGMDRSCHDCASAKRCVAMAFSQFPSITTLRGSTRPLRHSPNIHAQSCEAPPSGGLHKEMELEHIAINLEAR
jgi:hypothetical protein